MYGIAMSKIRIYLEDLEDAVITSQRFVMAKVRIQQELQDRLHSLPEGDPKREATHSMLRQWALLSGSLHGHKSGNLSSYITAISDLKDFLAKIEAE